MNNLRQTLPSFVQSLISNVTRNLPLPLFPPGTNKPIEPQTAFEYLYDIVAALPATTYSSIVAGVLALIFAVYKFSMTSYGRNSFGGSWGGRASPYSASVGRPDIDSQFEYIGGDHNTTSHYDPYHSSHHHSNGYPIPLQDDGEAPDCLIIKHKERSIELFFQAYAISDGLLSVGQVRKYAADKLDTDSRRLRMLYKGKTLRDDRVPIKLYGLKQQSEITVVITESRTNGIDGSGSDYSGSDREHGHHHHHKPGRDDYLQSQDPRGRDPSTARRRAQSTSQPHPSLPIPTPATHHQSIAVPRDPPQRTSRDSLRPITTDHYQRQPSPRRERSPISSHRARSPARELSPAPRARSPAPRHRATSPNPGRRSPPYGPTGAATSMPTPIPQRSSTPPANPNTPMGKVQALERAWRDEWQPQCAKFVANPPSSIDDRKKEQARLSELSLTKIVLKADEIEMEGDTDARTKRKSLLNEVNALLKKVDALAGIR